MTTNTVSTDSITGPAFGTTNGLVTDHDVAVSSYVTADVSTKSAMRAYAATSRDAAVMADDFDAARAWVAVIRDRASSVGNRPATVVDHVGIAARRVAAAQLVIDAALAATPDDYDGSFGDDVLARVANPVDGDADAIATHVRRMSDSFGKGTRGPKVYNVADVVHRVIGDNDGAPMTVAEITRSYGDDGGPGAGAVSAFANRVRNGSDDRFVIGKNDRGTMTIAFA